MSSDFHIPGGTSRTTENSPVQSSKTLENARGMDLEILMIMNKPLNVYKVETSVFGENTESKRQGISVMVSKNYSYCYLWVENYVKKQCDE